MRELPGVLVRVLTHASAPVARWAETCSKGVVKMRNLPGIALLVAVTACPLATAPRGPETRDRVSIRGQERLAKEVRHALVMLPLYGVFDNLTYRIRGYDVELGGQVSRPTLRTDAERVVKRIEGVERLVNRIEVLPLSPNDDRIRLRTYRAIYGHAMLNRYALQAVPPIHIIVRNGDVTLEGVVNNAAERNVANMQANLVPGVFRVRNNLSVER